jgi:arginine/lysine/ornithine decarboxylase
VFLTTAALLDFDVDWLYGENSKNLLCTKITADYLNEYLNKASEKPVAVYITSPDYLGNVTDIASLAAVCKQNSVLLLVDNAHGAYLKFLKEDIHPLSLGADICCDSAHKTLPVLTGGAYLHIGNERYVKGGKEALEIFGSTSPSYLILQSLDIANKYITEGYEKKLELTVKKVNALKNKLKSLGYGIQESDPLKLTVVSSGINLSERLRKKGIETEYEDPDYTVLMFTPDNTKEDFERVYTVLSNIKPCNKKTNLTFVKPKVKLSLRKAVFSRSERIKTETANGRILAAPTALCPPAVYPVVSGEVINSNTVEILNYYGIDEISVVI